MSLSYALIGCGRIAANHIAAALKNNLDIVALCDIAPNKMRDIITKFNLSHTIRLYTAYNEMLLKEKPQLVAICTESGKHGQIALDCIESGSNLIIEKPVTLSIAEVDKIIELSRMKKVKVSICHQNRFNKSVQKIREAVEQKRFNKLFYGTAHIRWNREENYYQQAAWRGTWEEDGGALMNQCIHNIDLLRWMMGDDIIEVIGITANLKHPYIATEDLGIAIIKFANGSYGIIEGTTNIYPRNLEETLCIFGEKGTVKAGGKSVNLIEEWHFADQLDEPEEVKEKYRENPPDVYGFGHNSLYADVIEAIKHDRAPYVTVEDGKRALELVLAIYKSAAEGRSVKLPLEKCSTLDFRGKFGL